MTEPIENEQYLIYADDGLWGKFWYVARWVGYQFITDSMNFILEDVEAFYPLKNCIAAYKEKYDQTN